MLRVRLVTCQESLFMWSEIDRESSMWLQGLGNYNEFSKLPTNHWAGSMLTYFPNLAHFQSHAKISASCMRPTWLFPLKRWKCVEGRTKRQCQDGRPNGGWRRRPCPFLPAWRCPTFSPSPSIAHRAEVPEKLCSISNHLTETVPWPTALGKQSP